MEHTFVLAQISVVGDAEKNLEKATQMIEKAVSLYHPHVMIFPEYSMSYFPKGTDATTVLGAAQTLDGPFVTGMRNEARRHGIWVIFGMNEVTEDASDHRNYNTIVVVDDRGEIVTTYRKTHLYDAFGYLESDSYKPGEQLFQPIDTPFGRIGLFVCYEVRFPEVARYQRAHGADIIIMPTAWMAGKMKNFHFRTLITARAIENTVYMLACNQCGEDFTGESVVVDPMGVPVVSGGETDTLMVAHIDLERVKQVREKLPAYQNRRPELYTI